MLKTFEDHKVVNFLTYQFHIKKKTETIATRKIIGLGLVVRVCVLLSMTSYILRKHNCPYRFKNCIQRAYTVATSIPAFYLPDGYSAHT